MLDHVRSVMTHRGVQRSAQHDPIGELTAGRHAVAEQMVRWETDGGALEHSAGTPDAVAAVSGAVTPAELAWSGSAVAATMAASLDPTLTLTHSRQATILAVAGEIDLATAGSFERQASRTLHHVHGLLILDLTETTFMDLSGARALDRLGRQADGLGGRLVVVAVTRGVRLALDHMPPSKTLITSDRRVAVGALERR